MVAGVVADRAGIGSGNKAEEISVARLAGYQQGAAMDAIAIFVVDIRADDRLDAGIATGGVELHQPEQVGAVRQRHGRHAELGHSGG